MLSLFMVISEEVEKTVDEQALQFLIEREAVFKRLPLCLVEIDNDITEQKAES